LGVPAPAAGKEIAHRAFHGRVFLVIPVDP
jgi:hypothetical protein